MQILALLFTIDAACDSHLYLSLKSLLGLCLVPKYPRKMIHTSGRHFFYRRKSRCGQYYTRVYWIWTKNLTPIPTGPWVSAELGFFFSWQWNRRLLPSLLCHNLYYNTHFLLSIMRVRFEPIHQIWSYTTPTKLKKIIDAIFVPPLFCASDMMHFLYHLLCFVHQIW